MLKEATLMRWLKKKNQVKLPWNVKFPQKVCCFITQVCASLYVVGARGVVKKK